jgi:hypothetical protein
MGGMEVITSLAPLFPADLWSKHSIQLLARFFSPLEVCRGARKLARIDIMPKLQLLYKI